MSADFCGSFGINTKFGFAPSGEIDATSPETPTIRQEILAENLTFADARIGGRGLTGYIDPVENHLRQGQRLVNGGLVMEIGPNELDPWIDAILGSTDNNAAETWSSTAVDLSLERDLVAHAYRHCIVSQARISCRKAGMDEDDRENQIMQMALNFVGVEEHPITFPSGLALPTDKEQFWILADSALTLDNETYPVDQWTITIQNMIQPLFRNQIVPGCFRTLGRRITLDVVVPFAPTSSTNLFDADFNGDGDITLNSDILPSELSDYSTIFTFRNLYRVNKEAVTRGRGETPLTARFQAYRNGTENPLSITNVHSP